MTGERIAREARRLAGGCNGARAEMKAGLAEVRAQAGAGGHAAAASRAGQAIVQENSGRTSCTCFVNVRTRRRRRRWRPACCCCAGALGRARPGARAALPASTWSSTPSTREISPEYPIPGGEGHRPLHPAGRQHHSATFELNNALNVSRVVDAKGKQIPASRNQQDSTVRLSFDQPLAKGQPVTITFYYDGKLTGQEDSPVYGIKFAAIHPDFAYLMYPARWFPVSGYTTDRFAADMRITVPRATRCWPAACDHAPDGRR